MTRPDPDAASNDSSERECPRIAELEARLRESEETLDAIRNGEVDAVVVGGPAGQQVYTLENADRPYRVLIEQMQEGAVTLSGDGTVLYCNQRFALTVGSTRERIIGHLASRFFDSGEREAFERLIARGPGAGASGEFTLCGRNGVEVPVNISLVDLKVEEGMPRVVCGVVTDLTHNRRRRHELAAANARLASEIEERRRAEDSLQLALDAAGMSSWDLDLSTGLVRRSPQHDAIFGYSEPLPEWRLQTLLQHFTPEDRAAAEAAFSEAHATGALDFVLPIQRAGDGAIRWVQSRGKTYLEGNVPVRIAGVVADVTDARGLEEQLRQAQKMEAVGQLTGGIAHDFNNLLMIIGGSLDMLSRRVSIDEKTRRLLDAARQGVDRGARLNHQLLAFSRRQDLHVEAVSVDDLISNFAHLLERAVGATISVRIERSSDVWYCKTDPHQLETAILNLAINARDAMPYGGVLRLLTENRSLTSQAAAGFGGGAGDYVTVSVADTGVGMSPDVLARVFEPFFTTKEIGAGTGLGLSQVYGFARQSGGFVTIESELGRGAKVSIFLPRCSPQSALGELAPQQSTEQRGRGRILVVEDEPDVRATASSMLEDLGYQVLQAETGARALAILEEEDDIDLVFTDVILPDGMGGLDLARRIARRRPTLPVLLTSGYTAQRFPDPHTSKLQLLRKPYEQSTLSQAVATALKGRVETWSEGVAADGASPQCLK
ncbi:MAG TPA: ATP-binding protein [Beijerinckiaceae bacterium]|nr:ATP-binding protein [Beijerinckiaceae bacterium]HVB90223.1 ATP-binding protein [Beijerinckiaceae bacterium]